MTKASVTLNGLSHSFPRDVNVLLVSPTGGKTLLMSHTGGGHGITNLSLTFDDGAAGLLPATTQISSGSYQPTSYAGPVTFPSPAPAQPYGTTLSSVAGRDPNGNWSLFVFDDSNGDAGSIGGGWTLNLTTAVTINNPADLAVSMSSTPASLYAGAVLTNTINVTNLGPSAATGVMLSHPLGAGVSFVSVSGTQGSLVSSGGGVVTYNVGSLSVGGSARVAIVVAPSFGGFLTNSVSVAGNETDIDSNNNVAQTVTTVISPLPAHLTAQIVAGQMEITVSAEPGLTYILQGSTNLLSWVPISTNTAGTGTFKVVDPSSTSLSARYYRAVRRIP